MQTYKNFIRPGETNNLGPKEIRIYSLNNYDYRVAEFDSFCAVIQCGNHLKILLYSVKREKPFVHNQWIVFYTPRTLKLLRLNFNLNVSIFSFINLSYPTPGDKNNVLQKFPDLLGWNFKNLTFSEHPLFSQRCIFFLPFICLLIAIYWLSAENFCYFNCSAKTNPAVDQ